MDLGGGHAWGGLASMGHVSAVSAAWRLCKERLTDTWRFIRLEQHAVATLAACNPTMLQSRLEVRYLSVTVRRPRMHPTSIQGASQ